MKTLNHLLLSPVRLSTFSSLVALGALTGCIGYVEEPHHARGYATPQPVYAEHEVVAQPQYVYYPGYQVYYARHTRQYVYREGRSWVSRPAPPRVSVDVLFASPSVNLSFRDAPSRHHSRVVRQYPRNWKPLGSNPRSGRQGNRGYERGNGRGDRR